MPIHRRRQSQRDNEQSVTQAAGTTEAAETGSNILVAYFSWADNAVIDGDVDAVSLGYPNWWYGVPMALLSFLEENDLSGKQVSLFGSQGPGGLADSVDIIEEAVPDAEISDNIFDCYEEDASSSRSEIQSWVEELGY